MTPDYQIRDRDYYWSVQARLRLMWRNAVSTYYIWGLVRYITVATLMVAAAAFGLSLCFGRSASEAVISALGFSVLFSCSFLSIGIVAILLQDGLEDRRKSAGKKADKNEGKASTDAYAFLFFTALNNFAGPTCYRRKFKAAGVDPDPVVDAIFDFVDFDRQLKNMLQELIVAIGSNPDSFAPASPYGTLTDTAQNTHTFTTLFTQLVVPAWGKPSDPDFIHNMFSFCDGDEQLTANMLLKYHFVNDNHMRIKQLQQDLVSVIADPTPLQLVSSSSLRLLSGPWLEPDFFKKAEDVPGCLKKIEAAKEFSAHIKNSALAIA